MSGQCAFSIVSMMLFLLRYKVPPVRGLLIGLAWPAALIFCAVWLAIAAITRYSSLAALIASAVIPPLLLWLQYLPLATLFAVLSAILWFKHRANIRRLMDGSEGKIGAKT